MKTWLSVMLIGLTAVFASAQEPLLTGFLDNGAEYISDRFIVTMYDGTMPLETNQTVSGTAVTGNNQIDVLCRQHKVIKVELWFDKPVKSENLKRIVARTYTFYVDPSLDVRNFKDEFKSCREVEYADYWDLPRLAYTPNDPAVSSQWALGRVLAFDAWDLIRGDTTTHVVISINDTGVYWNHPDLRDNMWVNPSEDANHNGVFNNTPYNQGGDLNGIDDDGNGYIDDVVGYDVGDNPPDPNPEENSPTHGTHVAGCASEVADNGIGGAGLGFRAKIQAVKITNDADQLVHGNEGIIYAMETGVVNVINISWGSPSFNGLTQNLINAAYSEGILTVAAAGNDDYWTPPYINYPSAYTVVLAVAATDPNDHMSSFSNFGAWVDVSAPGSNIYSTWAQNAYANLAGTSMSSPIVAGIAALLYAQTPGATAEEVTNAIKGAADNIDDLNPDYEGLIGSGRVNAHAALGAANYPNIVLLSHAETLTSDDGDGVMNPGESIDLVVTLQNLWQDATNSVLTLRGPQGISITDSTVNAGTIPGSGEEYNNSSDPFSLTFDPSIRPGDYTLTLAISANAYSVEREFEISISLDLANFPISLADAISSHPIISDIDGDGQFEILIGCNNGTLYSIENDGSYTHSWPYNASGSINTGPAVGDLDGDGDFEVVAATSTGNLIALNNLGDLLPGFPIATGESIFATPCLGDLDGNGDLEIIQPDLQPTNIDIYNHDGSHFGNWPYTGAMGWHGGAALGDIDGDSSLEIVIGGFDSKLHVFNADKTEVTGFPLTLNNRVWGTPAIGNIDPTDDEPEIVVATQTGRVYVVNHDGSIQAGWPIEVGSNVKSSPSLGDLDNNGGLEIILGASNGGLYVYNPSGSLRTGFPVTLQGRIEASAAIADLNGDDVPEIIIANGGAETYLYAFTPNGQAVRNFPIPTQVVGEANSSPAVWDLDRDGDLDIVVAVTNIGDNLEVIDYKDNASVVGIQWSAYGNDKFRSSNHDALGPVSVDDKNQPLPVSFNLMQNYPNPFNSNTVISYGLDTPAVVSLVVYDVLGRQVRILDEGVRQAGTHEVVWKGRDDSGQDVTSGVYFYKLKADGKMTVKRMLYLR